jgi:hypothetical protein
VRARARGEAAASALAVARAAVCLRVVWACGRRARDETASARSAAATARCALLTAAAARGAARSLSAPSLMRCALSPSLSRPPALLRSLLSAPAAPPLRPRSLCCARSLARARARARAPVGRSRACLRALPACLARSLAGSQQLDVRALLYLCRALGLGRRVAALLGLRKRGDHRQGGARSTPIDPARAAAKASARVLRGDATNRARHAPRADARRPARARARRAKAAAAPRGARARTRTHSLSHSHERRSVLCLRAVSLAPSLPRFLPLVCACVRTCLPPLSACRVRLCVPLAVLRL